RLGPVVVKGDHFYTGDRRIRFWGVNLAFSACFPTHDQADRLALRLSRFGINAVRLHHMDMFKFPNGIFADDALESLSDQSLDRLDYLISALKKQGIYSDINLHVSRTWSKAHRLPNADKLPESMDKTVNLFHPDIIRADKRYARDLLTHVNKYTAQPYTAEPAVCMVEINNENTIFLWGGEQKLATLPEPYAGMLKGRWNQWLASKYPTRDALAAAWNRDAIPLGQDILLRDKWIIEQHDSARMTHDATAGRHILKIGAVDGTHWHLQFNQQNVAVTKGRFYTLTFTATADKDQTITVNLTQAHQPWGNLGLAGSAKVSTRPRQFRFGFVGSADDTNARVSFIVGQQVNTVTFTDLQLRPGGQEGLGDSEDAAKQTVAPHKPGDGVTPARSADWYDFLQRLDESYFVDFRNYLRDDLKLQAPVTGTIGLGPLGTLSQSKMDFVDAHAYWDHPDFPNHDWSPRNWTIRNKPMVDNPVGATLWPLAATRVAGKPFTVTEYNHAAPNEWQAGCVPMIATFAALQDWDAVYLFAYSHSNQFEKDHVSSYFDLEGNWAKMASMPLGARIFLSGNVPPLAAQRTLSVTRQQIYPFASASFYNIWNFIRAAHPDLDWRSFLSERFALRFDGQPTTADHPSQPVLPLAWTANGPGTGRYTLATPAAAVFTGFAPGAPVALGSVQLEQLKTPFASILVTPADPASTIDDADRLLISAVARVENTGEQWNPQRTTISTNWGTAPPRIEVVNATLRLPHDYSVHPLDGAGKPLREFQTTNCTLHLGDVPTLWYELVRLKH
ncbi:MAG TPA: carbohydrate binding domain-containing protein, partial [Tepidisphaeraceae bacterium]